MRLIRTVAAAALLLMPALSYAAPVTTSPGKSSVFVAETGTLDFIGDITSLSAQILKGKAHQVLRVDVTVMVGGAPSLTGLYTRAQVNGIDMNPGPYGSTEQCDTASTLNCSATGTYWVDIDTLETSMPGAFVNQPLNISINGGNNAAAGSGLAYHVSMSAQMVKK
jgi:hypothetical protein